MILEFTPRAKAKYYEVVEVRTQRSTLHLHLHGCGVEPNLVVSPDSGTWGPGGGGGGGGGHSGAI